MMGRIWVLAESWQLAFLSSPRSGKEVVASGQKVVASGRTLEHQLSHLEVYGMENEN